MSIKGSVTIAVLDNNGVAVSTFAAGKKDLAVSCALDWRAACGSIIYALVRAYLVQDGVLTAVRKT